MKNIGNSKMDDVSTNNMLLLMMMAYLFSVAMRLIWVWQFKDNPNFIWNGQLMINTNDGYYWTAGAQHALSGLHDANPRMGDIWSNGVIFFTVLFAKITPFSFETIILYMPSVISSLVVVPMILIARLYKQTVWGFFAALLGSITWSYYNRTMVGYYDTDMFSAMAPMFILYFLIKSTIDLNLKTALYAAIMIAIYPFLYDQGLAIVYAMGIIYGAYMVWFHRDQKATYSSLILVFVSLIPLHIAAPFEYIAHLVILLLLFFVLNSRDIEKSKLIMGAAITFVLFLMLGNVFGLIWHKIVSYTIKGTEDGVLHFYAVNQTVREAGRIPFSVFAHRTSGSNIGVILALIGYIVLVVRKPAFILALPLIGIGIFSMWGGLRFTVYAVPIAAMSAVYLFWIIAKYFIKDDKLKYAFVALATAGMIYPNITHIIGYKVPTVFNKAEVQDLEKLNKIASSKDYTLTWWDYGYPIWYYGDTSTLIDGGKHDDDNFIISKIMQTSSPTLAANLSRLAVESYVDGNYSVVADRIFKKEDPNLLLTKLSAGDYKIPVKTRDVYLYMPYRMLDIFSTVMVFGNLDLTTGSKLRNAIFYPTYAKSNQNGLIVMTNGIIFDANRGILKIGREKSVSVKKFIVTQNAKDNRVLLQSKIYHMNGEFDVIYMKSYGRFVILDDETLHSMYVQMFILGKYDKNLFELKVASPYTRIYKLKR